MTSNLISETNDPPISGIQIFIDPTDAVATAGVAAMVLDSRATLQYVLDIAARNLSGTLAEMRYGASTALTGALIGYDVNFVTNVTPGTQNITAFCATLPTSGTGALTGYEMDGANGQTMGIAEKSEAVTLSTSGATTDTTMQIPANSFILGVDVRCTTTVAGTTSTGLDVGDATTSTRFISQAGLTTTNTAVGLNHLQGSVATDATGPIVTAATAIRLTLSGGGDNTPSAGAYRVTVRYINFGAATS